MRAKVYAYTCIRNLDKQGDLKSYLRSFCVRHMIRSYEITTETDSFTLNSIDSPFIYTFLPHLYFFYFFSNSLRQVISDQLAYYLVSPNKLPVQLIENLDINRFKFPTPAVSF